jgi:hypothetical protein
VLVGIDPAVDAGSKGQTRLHYVVDAGSKGETRWLGTTLFYPHKINEDLGQSFEMTVEQSN